VTDTNFVYVYENDYEGELVDLPALMLFPQDSPHLDAWAANYDGVVVNYPAGLIEPAAVSTVLFGPQADGNKYVATFPSRDAFEWEALTELDGPVAAFVKFPKSWGEALSHDSDVLIQIQAEKPLIQVGGKRYLKIWLAPPADSESADNILELYQTTDIDGWPEYAPGYAAQFEYIKSHRKVIDRKRVERWLERLSENEAEVIKLLAGNGAAMLARALRLLTPGYPDEIDLLHAQTLIEAANAVRQTRAQSLDEALAATAPTPRPDVLQALLQNPELQAEVPPAWVTAMQSNRFLTPRPQPRTAVEVIE
jgi:hypothetical protein